MSIQELKRHGAPDFPFELYTVDRHHPHYEMAFHWHTSVEIVRVLEGALELTLGNCALRAEAGEIIFINSEVIHGATPLDCRYECLVFSLPFLYTGNHACDTFLEDLLHQTIRIHRRLQGAAKGAAEQLLESMRATRGTEGHMFRVLADSYHLFSVIQATHQWISDLQSAEKRDEKHTLKLKRTLAFIRESYDRPISTEQMAAAADLSVKYFCTFFKRMTGKSPVSYLTSFRIEQAARLLLSSDMSVMQVGYACGFNDLSYFIKTFKALMGTTPRAYRETVVHES